LNPIAALVRRISMWRIAAHRAHARALLEEEDIAVEIFNGGGSGSLNLAAGERALTELSAGSGLLDPHLFDYYSNIHFEPACFFALQAVRSSDPGYITCQGGGYIASGEPGWDRVPRPWLPDGAKLVSAEGCGEVQTPLRLVRDNEVAIGDPVIFRHAKAGELAERFEEYLLVSGGKIVSKAKTYRGLGRCFF
jgi:D-serine deaminase-like pyridoxal phosphate-dependent protein